MAVLLSAAMVFGQTGAPVYADTAAQAEDPQAPAEDAALSAAAEEDAAVRGENASPEQSVSRKATASNAKKATGSNAEAAHPAAILTAATMATAPEATPDPQGTLPAGRRAVQNGGTEMQTAAGRQISGL